MDYEIIKIRTVMNKDAGNSGLSFVEGEHDIPFDIKRMYFVYKDEEEMQKGFHPHKQSWHLLFCPNGRIDVIIDNGTKRETVSLDSPEKGLILHPGLWREIIWKEEKSVLCVAASGHYEAYKYKKNYELYLRFLEERRNNEKLETVEILGETE